MQFAFGSASLPATHPNKGSSMSEPEFTPAPWNVMARPDGAFAVLGFDKDFPVVMPSSSHPRAKANATLIAAAPDLYDALWQILDDMGRDGTCCCSAAKEQAIAAMARARGEIINTSS